MGTLYAIDPYILKPCIRSTDIFLTFLKTSHDEAIITLVSCMVLKTSSSNCLLTMGCTGNGMCNAKGNCCTDTGSDMGTLNVIIQSCTSTMKQDQLSFLRPPL